MNQSIKGVAKRLTFSLVVGLTILVVASALGGCAVYGPPPNPGPYVVGTDANGQPVYAAPPVYAAAPVYAAPYYPNPYYANPYYYDPLFVGPPVFFNFGYRSFNGGRGYGPGFRGGRGGFRGGAGRAHR